MSQCKFKRSDGYNCGSFAFNLRRDGIEQQFCDMHHWQTEADRLRAEVEALRADASAVIRQCRDALAEELSAYDIQPPIYHVLKAHERCVAWLSVRAEQGAST